MRVIQVTQADTRLSGQRVSRVAQRIWLTMGSVSTDTMPGLVGAFAEYQPVTSIVNAIRDLLTQQPVDTDIWIALDRCDLPPRARAYKPFRRAAADPAVVELLSIAYGRRCDRAAGTGLPSRECPWSCVKVPAHPSHVRPGR
jgi:hypothetical protein